MSERGLRQFSSAVVSGILTTGKTSKARNGYVRSIGVVKVTGRFVMCLEDLYTNAVYVDRQTDTLKTLERERDLNSVRITRYSINLALQWHHVLSMTHH